jgi:transposase
MERQAVISNIQEKYQLMLPSFTERTKRLWCAVEAYQLGWGGVSVVQQATGISMPTIRKGIHELEQPVELTPAQSRRKGGGRKNLTEHYAELPQVLDTLIDPVMRGDPESPLRWTCKSTRLLANELNRQGYEIGPTKVRFLLHELEYSLQSNQKTREGEDHPDRNEQFLYINNLMKKFLHAGQPVISVDTKKKACCQENGSVIIASKDASTVPKKRRLKRTCTTFSTRNLARPFLMGFTTSDAMKAG